MSDLSCPVLVRLSPEDKAVLVRLAAERSVSLSALVRMLLRGQVKVTA